MTTWTGLTVYNLTNLYLQVTPRMTDLLVYMILEYNITFVYYLQVTPRMTDLLVYMILEYNITICDILFRG